MTDIQSGRNQHSQTREEKRRMKTRRLYLMPALAILLGLTLIAAAWYVAVQPSVNLRQALEKFTGQQESVSPAGSESTDPKPELSPEDVQRFSTEELLPLLKTYRKRNEATVSRAVQGFKSGFDEYASGIPDFAEDLSSWKTRFGVLKRSGQDLWNTHVTDDTNSDLAGEYIQDRFHEHVFSRADLEDLITRVTEQFVFGLEANRNRLHAAVETAWRKAEYTIGTFDLEGLDLEVEQLIQDRSLAMGLDSVKVGIASELGGFVLGEFVVVLLNRAILQIGTAGGAAGSIGAATSLSGVMAGGKLGGASGAALGGPLGAIVGVGAGVIVGICVDLVLSRQFKEKIAEECQAIVRQTRMYILYGAQDRQGLRSALGLSARELERAELAALQTQLKESVQ